MPAITRTAIMLRRISCFCIVFFILSPASLIKRKTVSWYRLFIFLESSIPPLFIKTSWLTWWSFRSCCKLTCSYNSSPGWQCRSRRTLFPSESSQNNTLCKMFRMPLSNPSSLIPATQKDYPSSNNSQIRFYTMPWIHYSRRSIQQLMKTVCSRSCHNTFLSMSRKSTRFRLWSSTSPMIFHRLWERPAWCMLAL